LVAQHPLAFCAFEFPTVLSKFRDPVELNDDAQLLNQDVNVVVVAADADVNLRSDCEGADGTHNPQERSFRRIRAPGIDGLQNRMCASVPFHVPGAL